MKTKVSLIFFIISIFIIGIDGGILRYFTHWKESFGDIGSNVKVLFSPNLYTAYRYKLENMSEIVHNPEFDRKLPTVVYIHGYLNDGGFEYSAMAIRSAYRAKNNQNFIAIDWSAFSHFTLGIPYFGNINKLETICKGIAIQLEMIRTGGCSCYKNFYLVGHSLGGQCAGLVGRYLRNISNESYVIPRIYALDPAGPDFEYAKFQSSFDCISKDDADYVQVIHTNGNKYGVKGPVGHADFYPNGGMNQPGCKDDSNSHQFAWIFYQQSVREEAGFLARKCDSYDNFQNGNCENNEISYMGYSSNGTLPMGTFYLRTHPSMFGPALGEEGITNKQSYLILQDGTKTVNPGKYGFMAPVYNPNSTNGIPIDKYNEMLRNQHIRSQRIDDSEDENSSE
ncbi:phospholipase A1-like [Chironomus tepperi]|uniref:phospholipase A1-like n=1 Tax=Chironomus tepperi TaxID=113505 RepID=UPI00391F8EFD